MIKVKKLVSFALSIAVILSCYGISFAADSMDFTGTPINLTLNQAYDRAMTTGSAIETAKLNKLANENAAASADNAVSMLNKSIALGGDYPGKAGREMIREQQDYSGKQADAKYQAELNAIKVNTMKIYYSTKNAEDMLQIAKENLEVQQKIRDNTKLKYSAGTVSKQDVTSADIAVNTAQNKVIEAENGVKTARMNLNIYFDYDLMQDVNLTDSIQEIPMPTKNLDASIQDAIANRNEIKDAAFNAKIQSLQLETMFNYNRQSIDYLNQKHAVLEADKTNADIKNVIEMDVRNKYMAMSGAKSKITLGKASLEQAKENFRLAQLSFDAGMNTLTDVQNGQLAVFSAETDLAQDMLDYNVAVLEYEVCSTVGSNDQSMMGSGK